MADLEELIRRIAREEARTPEYVTQRNVESVVGLSRRAYLRASLAGRWATTREQRLVVARTADVMRYVERRIALRDANPANDQDVEAAAFARVGARRISK